MKLLHRDTKLNPKNCKEQGKGYITDEDRSRKQQRDRWEHVQYSFLLKHLFRVSLRKSIQENTMTEAEVKLFHNLFDEGFFFYRHDVKKFQIWQAWIQGDAGFFLPIHIL